MLDNLFTNSINHSLSCLSQFTENAALYTDMFKILPHCKYLTI